MTQYLSRLQARSSLGVLSGYFAGCTAYPESGRLTVVLRHRFGLRLRRPFSVVALDPPTIEIDNPQNYEGFVPIARGAHRPRRADS
jgi:hypothetical protein